MWFACKPWRHKDIWHDFTQCIIIIIIIIIINNILFVLLLIMCDVIIIATKQYKTRDPSERSGSGRWSYHAVREAQQGTGGVISFIGYANPQACLDSRKVITIYIMYINMCIYIVIVIMWCYICIYIINYVFKFVQMDWTASFWRMPPNKKHHQPRGLAT